jgi:Mrp family chromosome partitioning ATPase
LSNNNLANFNQFFQTSTLENRDTEFFKESLRRLRHDIETSGGRSFLFVSLKPNEGKSFLVAALAHSLGLKNKKILLIDTNFKNNTLTSLTSSVLPKGEAQKSLGTSSELGFPINLSDVDIIGNKGGHQSPSELLAGVDFRRKVDGFKEQYDYIFLEAASVSSFSDARELADYVDKIVPVFDATTKLKDTDREGVAFLRRLNGKLLGGVLNKADLKQI